MRTFSFQPRVMARKSGRMRVVEVPIGEIPILLVVVLRVVRMVEGEAMMMGDDDCGGVDFVFVKVVTVVAVVVA